MIRLWYLTGLLFVLTGILAPTNAQDACDNADCTVTGIDLSTGVDHLNSNAPIAAGQQDPFWEVIRAPGNNLGPAWVIAPTGPQAPPFGSVASSGQWVSPSASPITEVGDDFYTLRRCICLCEGQAILNHMEVFATDEIVEVRINGAAVHSSSYQVGSTNDYTRGISLEDFEVDAAETSEVCIEVDIRKREDNGLPLSMMFFGVVDGDHLLRPACCESCQTSILNLNSGVDHIIRDRYDLPPTGLATSQDAFWRLIAAPNQPPVNLGPAWVITPNSGWHSSGTGTTDAQWISAFRTPGNPDEVQGTYTYERCFCLSQTDNVTLDLRVFADDEVQAIRVNNNVRAFSPAYQGVGDRTHFQQGVTLNDPTVQLDQGRNCIQIDVQDTDDTASGLKVEGNILGAFLENASCCDTTGSISGFKYNDVLPNGIHDFGEPGLAGWVITLSNGQRDTTDQNGYYSFTGLTPGMYTITEIQQTGWQQTFPAGNQPHIVNLTGGQALLRNFLNTRADYSIRGKKFHDLNCDGERQENEPFLEGWTFDLISATDLTDTLQTVLSDGNGCFEFNNLPVGGYYVSERPRDGWTQTFPSSGAMQVVNIGVEDPSPIEFGNCLVADPDACCEEPGGEGVIFSEDFEQGVNLTTGYVAGTGVNPGEYAFVDATQANTLSGGGWDVVGFSNGGTNCDPTDRFMVVNGRTRQSGVLQVYRSPILNTQAGERYSVCVRFKDLTPCVFPVDPVVQVQARQWPPIFPGQPLFASPWTTIRTNSSDNCDYLTIKGTFIATPPSPPFNQGIALSILLDEKGIGDGNDLAIDEIVVSRVPQVPTSQIVFAVRNNPISADTFEVWVEPTPLEEGCTESWKVYQVADFSDLETPIPGTTMSGDASTTPPWGPGIHYFPGYNAPNNQNGVFLRENLYVIKRSVDCKCQTKNEDLYLWYRGPEGEGDAIDLYGKSPQDIYAQLDAQADVSTSYQTITEAAKTVELAVSPNPFTTTFRLNLNTVLSQDSQLKVIDMQGKHLQVLTFPAQTKEVEIDLSHLPQGVYVLRLMIEDRMVQQKIIKQ